MCAALVLGLVLALAGVGHDHPALLELLPPRARPVRWWVADRAAGRLFGLDAGLLVRVEQGVRAPVAVATGSAGTWVASARGGGRDGPHHLVLLDECGACIARHPVGPVRCLETDARGAAWWLEQIGGEARVVVCAPGEAPREHARLAGGNVLRLARDALLVGAPWGELWCLRRGALVASAALGGELADLAAARSGWWALTRERVFLLDAQLEVVFERRLDAAGGCLVAAADGGVWVLARDAPCVTRLDRAGGRLFARAALPVRGFTAARAVGGGLVAATPDALLALDARGRVVCGQGGFDYVAALAPSGGAWGPPP